MASWTNRFFGRSQEPDPRKRVTGTSYQAQGTIKPDPGILTEKGSSRGGIIRERVPALVSPAQAIQQYDWMANADPAVDVSLRASKMPIMGAMYFVEPASDDPLDLDIAEFVSHNLLEGQSAPFLLVLEDILRMFEYGYSVVEKVYETREWAPKRTRANRRKYTMLKKLASRPTPTILKINYDDNGGPTGVEHSAIRKDGKPEKVEIEINQLIIFTNNRRNGNLEGKSILRTAYQPWYYKDNLYKIDGIQKERHGMGFPVVTLPPGYTDNDKEAAFEMVRNVRTNEFGGAVLPPGFVFEFADLPGQPVDVLSSIEHHNGMIMLNTMVQFLLLGLEGSGGGRATSGSHQDMFTKSLRYVGNMICDYINLYCVPQLVGYNFETDRFPKLQVKNIGETKDLQQWASAIANLIARNAITVDLEFEQWVRSIVDSPQKRGGKQTPEANQTSTFKGDVNQENQEGGNLGEPTDAAD